MKSGDTIRKLKKKTSAENFQEKRAGGGGGKGSHGADYSKSDREY